MEIQIFSPEMKRLCYVDAFKYFYYQRNYYESDTFQLTIGSKSPQYSYCRVGNILVYKNNNISTVCTIKSEEETSDGMITTMTLKGKAYVTSVDRYLLDKVKDAGSQGFDVQTGSAETLMKYFVTRSCIYPAKTCRALPNLANAPDFMNGISLTYKGRLQLLENVLSEIGRRSSLGWHCYYSNGVIYFDVLTGLNMTEDIKFDQDEGNIIVKSTHYELSPTTAIITDSISGENKSFLYVERFDPPPPTVPNQVVLYIPPTPRSWWVNTTRLVEEGIRSGLNRSEILIESTDSGVEKDMLEKGSEALEEKNQMPSITVELVNKNPYEYMKDFFIGDAVHIETDYYAGNARIVRVEEEILQNGSTKITMTIGKVREDMKTQMDYNNKIFMNEVRK